MKIRNFLYIVAVALCVFLSSCDFLDKMPDDQKTMEMVWENQKETEAYLYSIYSQLPDEHKIWEGCPFVGASDEADMIWERYPSAKMNVGNWSPSNTYYNKWGDYYKAIRASFVFENNVDKCYELSDALKTQYKAEVKFLRGYYYWKILQAYGPFVLMEKETNLDDDWNSYPRTPYDICVEYICKMLDEAEVDLPPTWKKNDKWLGKPDKVACKAVKSEVLLMAASPQWNGNVEYSNFKNQDGTQLVNLTYDQNKWKRAAEASKDLINYAETNADLNISLYKNNAKGGDSEFNPYKSVRNVHLEKWNSEALWSSTQADVNNFEKHLTPRPGGWNGMGATQRIVDAFYTKDGKTIDDPTSNYKETGFAGSAHESWKVNEIEEIQSGNSWGHRVGEWNMYANREARFYASVLYNGRPIPQSSTDDRNKYSSSQNEDGWGRAEFYYSGVSGANGADHSATGYLMLKFANPKSNPYRNQWSEWRQRTYIRLAGVYLNYIEALNEYDPNNADIKKYWDLIRERAGLPSIFDTYATIKGNKEQQLAYIIRERQVELCFEGDRYFTTRRRWIAHTTDTSRPAERRMFGDGGPMYGLNVGKGTSFSSTDFYERSKFEDRVFTQKMYLFPISQDEMDRNKSMVQNPLW